MIIRCECCARQIVSYRIDDEYCIGPASDGCMNLGTGRYACPPCSKIEREEEKDFLTKCP